MSSTITTPDMGLTHGTGTYTANGFAVPFYFASPRAKAPLPVIVVYDDAPHAFYADYRPSYRKDLAEPAFERALDWLAAEGVA